MCACLFWKIWGGFPHFSPLYDRCTRGVVRMLPLQPQKHKLRMRSRVCIMLMIMAEVFPPRSASVRDRNSSCVTHCETQERLFIVYWQQLYSIHLRISFNLFSYMWPIKQKWFQQCSCLTPTLRSPGSNLGLFTGHSRTNPTRQ